MDILCNKNILNPDPFLNISKYPGCQMDIYPYHISTIWIYILDTKEIGESRGVTKQEGGVATCATQKSITKYRNLFSRFRGQISALKRSQE